MGVLFQVPFNFLSTLHLQNLNMLKKKVGFLIIKKIPKIPKIPIWYIYIDIAIFVYKIHWIGICNQELLKFKTISADPDLLESTGTTQIQIKSQHSG